MMYYFWIVLFLGVQLFCLGLLWVSCFPGALTDVEWSLILPLYWLLTTPLGILILLLAFGFVIWSRRRWNSQIRPPAESLPKRQPRRFLKQLVVVTCLVLFLTSILIRINLPQTIAFSLSRPAFDAFIANEAKLVKLCRDPLKPQLGIYRIKDCDIDSQGGIYLQTGWHGFLFNSAAYGFVHRPNPHGSERFGKDIYEYHPVVEDWYWFRASQDW
ncbi:MULTISPECIES: hypothetical protein [Leptolyngbya]|uniref:hypothetical protein n=1 Tax=Leptolyngbya TaxID=47251 RepID=UPI0016891670|nr:hypothetical protein [Leptolyngbya sp. FACHB-1624]MBD1856726.1 hypothetical protein [Leptolyngbya sp. FACHB-1624]